ncbi:hypothetical protein MKW98_017736 [Papaver atlanticum]|uniref:Purple acid phosphatase Fn3-like domain-containing protein n=1 Tax=Papaver atlanticum TaxID=357466 RepID=A0AAD4TEK0_9MAGN|nr:hypothetical protein MKW98_017736 [Papaver atlanticum]
MMGVQPLSKIFMHELKLGIHAEASIKATTHLLELKGESSQWINVKFKHPHPSADDWIAVFSPAIFNAPKDVPTMGVPAFLSPLLVSAPIKTLVLIFEKLWEDKYTALVVQMKLTVTPAHTIKSLSMRSP